MPSHTSLLSGTPTAAWLHTLVPELLDTGRLESIVGFTDGEILRDVPEIDSRVLREKLHASSLALGRLMLPALVTGVTPTDLPAEAIAFAESIAASGLGLRVLLRICRSGQQAMIRMLSEQIGVGAFDAEVTRELLLHVAGSVTDWSGAATEILSRTFDSGHQVDPGRRFRRRETAQAIISGAAMDLATAEARMGYPLRGSHLAFTIWLEDDTSAPLPTLERAARDVASQLHARALFTLACGDRGLWAWARTDRSADTEIESITAGTPLRLAFGVPATGMAGFRRSHLESLAAQRMLRRLVRPGTVVCYDWIELEYLLGHDDEAMHTFIDRELSGLSGIDANALRLRETLANYLESMCSIEATARQLGVHRNTIRYRLERIEALLGHTIEDRRLKLELALHCAASLGIDNGRCTLEQ